MPASAHLDPMPDRFVGLPGTCRLAHRVGQR
ncbi:MAG: hypothetical protein QOK15_1762, partial [Nocardioidaceae bacterium]|nr:hypothetical protein [Nocardioidaceae bacterium]